eukprot:TRINITY_DN11836_c0_g1_i1.p2 TRINITY_DN11836_c0_g1~~TRINITY_DN11836_c0_g1_i1.p2  ORF type:complete len:123 (+),score=31.26 TRINITY_DN11836_c0_g1_i1:55-369(+)
MDEIRDQMDVANEISDVISQPIGPGLDVDDDDLQAELDELAGLDLDRELKDVSAVGPSTSKSVPAKAPPTPPGRDLSDLPAAPSDKLPAAEEEELKRLQADLAL